VPIPDTVAADGSSWLSVLLDQPRQDPVRTTLVTESPRTRIFREGPWKLIPHPDWLTMSPEKRRVVTRQELPGELYNLSDDVEERENQWAAHPEIVARLLAQLERYF